MANIQGFPEITLTMTMGLEEAEAKALLLLSEYNIEEVLKALYPVMGERVVEDNREGFASLFKTVRQPLSYWISRIKVARKSFHEYKG